MFLMRVFLYLRYPSSFDDLAFYELITSFLMGTRVDIIALNTFIGLIFFTLILPFKFISHKYIKYTLMYIWLLILIVILYISLGDILYFEYVGRHISTELFAATGGDVKYILKMAIDFYLMENIVSLVLIISLIYIWKKLMHIDTEPKYFSIKAFIISIFILFLLILGVRSKIIDKPFGIADAFTTDKLSSGNLAINGFYALYRSASGSKKINHSFFKIDNAISTTQNMLISDNTKFISNKYPIMRQYTNQGTQKNYNIVIILLESWSSRYIDSFNGNMRINATPYFDKIASEGIKFTNAYANGQRSIEGITAVLSAQTIPIGLNYLGNGLELSKLSYLGKIAKKHNYSTISMQSSKRSSYRVGAISKLAGFDEYYGAEDFNNNKDEQSHTPPSFGTWDGNMFRFLFEKLDSIKKPFLSFSFTASTHPLFISPGKKWEKFKPHDDTNINGFLNTLHYSDEKLGEFIEKSKKKSWFKDTIFIFTADHTAIFSNSSEKLISNNIKFPVSSDLVRFEIPLVIYAPYIFEPKIVDTVVSQIDILPSILDTLNWNDSFSSVSSSLFDNSVKNRFAFVRGGNIEYLITKDSYISHTLKNRVSSSGVDLEKELLSIDQTLVHLINSNKLIP